MKKMYLLYDNLGFSLLETIVAITILGVGISIAAQLFSVNLRTAYLTKKYSKAVLYAESKMGELSIKDHIEEGSDRGTFPDDEDIRWETEIDTYVMKENEEEVDDPQDWIKVFKVRVSIFFEEGDREKKVELNSLKTEVAVPKI